MSSQNVLISGGARGIGRCLTRRFLENGNRVYVVDIDEAELKHTTTVHLEKYYKDNKIKSAVCNLRDVSDIRSKVSDAAKFFNNRIDVLINNGSIASPYWKDGKTMEDTETFDQWQAYIETNLTSVFAMSQACIPYMKHSVSEHDTGAQKISSAGPCIINIGSFRAHQSDPNQEGYAATKAGQLGLMHSMAVSLGTMGIRVNVIAPGRIRVRHESKEGDEKGQNWEELISDDDVDHHPTNRSGRPKDIADAAEYLVNAGFVTGQELVVDGGVLMKRS